MSRVEPNRNVYVGHRYVPLLVGEWDKSIQYEGLSIVTFKGASYTSKKMTPPGIDIENEEYWVVTGNYDAQVEYYRLETKRVSDDLAQAKIDLNERIDDTVEYVNTNVENLTIYVNDSVENLTGYVDDEVEELTGDIAKRGYDVTWESSLALDGDWTEAIDKAVSIALSKNIPLYFPNATFKTKGNTINDSIKIISDNATLIFHENPAQDWVLNLKGDNSHVENLIIDGNKNNLNNEYTGRGEGLRVEGKDCFLLNIKVNNTLDKETGNAFEIRGDNCNAYHCSSENAGYGAFRIHNAGDFYGFDLKGIDYRVKGFVTNGTNKTVHVNKGYFITNSTEIGIDGILGETGTGHTLDHLILEECFVMGTNTANTVKIVTTYKYTIKDCYFDGTESTSALRVQYQYVGQSDHPDVFGEGVISNTKLNGWVAFETGRDKRVKMDDVEISTPSGSTYNCNLTGYEYILNDVTFKGATGGAIRWEKLHPSGNKRVVMNNVTLDAAEDSTVLITRFSNILPREISINNLNLVKGSSSYTSQNASDINILENGNHYGLSKPSIGKWTRGWTVLRTNPSSGVNIGWVCVLSGEFGTDTEPIFREFGGIASEESSS